MIKFLTNSKCRDQNQNDTPANSRCNIFTQLTQSNTHLRNRINPNNVKLLSDDNAGIDFLTLCAMKKSQEEMSCETVCKMDTTYMPQPKPVKDLYNFVVPDMKVIDDLSFLIKFTDALQMQSTSYEDDVQIIEDNIENGNDQNVDNDNDVNYINVDDDNFWSTMQNEKNVDDEIKFEDILDESSDSNKTEISYLSEKIAKTEIDPVEVDEFFASNVEDDNAVMTETKKKLSVDTLDLEPSIFENILNESFSSSEDDFENKAKTNENTIFPDAQNEEGTKNIISILHNKEDTISIFHNVAKSNQDLLAPTELTVRKPNHVDKFIDELQDFDFNSDDDISEFIKPNKKNTSVRNPKMEESLLSITQAIGEIAQTKSNVAKSSGLSVSKEIEEDANWISVDIKCKTQKQEIGNTNSKIKLSNIKNNYTAKSCIFKQNLDILDNSDQDFMITEDNVKKFNELESSYFRDISKESEESSSHLPSTSRKHTEINSFADKSKNMKLCGTSTPIHNRRPGLSLKRNKSQSDVIEAPSRCMNDRKNENISESDVSVLEESPLNRKIARKNKRKGSAVRNKFIDDEAEVTDSVSSDESINDDDENLADFVSDTQYSQNPDMHAHYLQTIKSPIKKPGAFHFRKPPPIDPNAEILLSSPSSSQNSYIYVRNVSDMLQA